MAAELVSPASPWEEGLLEKGLQCPICIDFLCSPVKLECGHAFCRLCLLQSTRLAPDGRRCPACRSVISIRNPLQHPADATLVTKIRAVVPAETFANREAADAGRLEAFLVAQRRSIPVFFMKGAASRPGDIVALHFFEPRYKVLIRRAWEGNKLFLCTQRLPRGGDIGLLVQVDSATFLSDGRANIRGRGVERVNLQRVWLEEHTQGLYYADVGDGTNERSAQRANLPLAIDSGDTARELPVFFNSPAPAVGASVTMRLFEPRYLIMARKVWDSTQKLFIFAGQTPREGDAGTLVHVEQCRWDGEANVHLIGVGLGSVRLGSVRQDAQEGDLFYASCEIRRTSAIIQRRDTGKRCCSVQ